MPIVALRNVSKRFGRNLVLDGIDLDIDEGEVVAIIGRSGSGKSTLLRCINGLEGVDAGRIEVAGRPVSRKKAGLRALRREVGIVFQDFNLFPHLSVEENVTLGPIRSKGMPVEEARQLAASVLNDVGLGDKLAAYPAQLSGGQQQRVAIARAMAMEPRVYLFDEITSALDPELTGEVVGVLERLAGDGRTMILVTHELGFARRAATRLVFMHAGRIWEEGRPGALFETPKTPELAQFLMAVIRD